MGSSGCEHALTDVDRHEEKYFYGDVCHQYPDQRHTQNDAGRSTLYLLFACNAIRVCPGGRDHHVVSRRLGQGRGEPLLRPEDLVAQPEFVAAASRNASAFSDDSQTRFASLILPSSRWPLYDRRAAVLTQPHQISGLSRVPGISTPFTATLFGGSWGVVGVTRTEGAGARVMLQDHLRRESEDGCEARQSPGRLSVEDSRASSVLLALKKRPPQAFT